ncbi:DUF11 domain-containing protein [Erythrobacter ani]|uniref:DUF11 domain-containing protein n=1 Tax=Erythrobacter ani TaxID=2827235 RepID=A0ABS6SK30_9SPHN|nr:DUF11 domain-containing protein [Erythrobacter ani]MBV7264999.1 DUF11 domain-containing protein [Erythrobacter ani]
MQCEFAGYGGSEIGDKTAGVRMANTIRCAFVRVLLGFALLAASSSAWAQANIHNGGVPLNTDQNSSNTASGTLQDRASDSAAGTTPYNGAQFDFGYSVNGGGRWNGGVEYRVQNGIQILYLQATNVPVNQNRFAFYTIDFTRGVENLTFRIGGLDFQDTNRIQFFYQGTALNVSTAYFTGSSVNGSNVISAQLLSPTTLEVASRNNNGASQDLTLNYGEVTVPAGVLVDEVRVLAGKNSGISGNNTISFWNFNWSPIPIDAQDDSEDGVNGVDGQTNVLNVLGNDTLDDPNTAGSDAATTANVTISQDATTNANVTLDESSGEISVAAATPAGTYTVDYTICQINSVPANCDSAVATITVSPQVDLAIVKSNGVDEVFSGSTTTYTLTVTNNGPDEAVGPLVTDAPGAGISCDPGAVVTITGDGAPAGSFAFSDLSGTGITLGTLDNGQSATLSYSCQVN